jgi:hypothetical protein
MATAEDVLKVARGWLGFSEANGKFKQIIDIYNAHTPRARGYKVQYTDEWCATFVSACAIKAGATNAVPTECSCNYMIAAFKALGCWIENDAYKPSAGDIIFYDWQDTGAGDNRGGSDHVGIVETVENGFITVIEGNKNEVVARRKITVNGRYIRGYGVPKYDKTTKPQPKETLAKIEYYGVISGCGTINKDGENFVNLREFCDIVGLTVANYDKDTKVITLKVKG